MSTTARVVDLDHVQLAMPAGAEARATAFYDGLLGIPRVPKPPELEVRGGCWFERGGLRVHLGVDEDFRPARKAHPAFVVSNLDDLRATLEAAGHPVRHSEVVPGTPQWYVDDPFGNRIELLATVAASSVVDGRIGSDGTCTGKAPGASAAPRPDR